MQDHAHSLVAPHFEKILVAEFGNDGYRIEVSADGELLRVHYPTVLEVSGDYMANSVLIEFGGRNITEPNEEHEVSPDIAEFVPELVFPRSRVSVLSPARTFWEKATLMHVESQRGVFRPNADRLSRHWYDLSMLADMDIGQAALKTGTCWSTSSSTRKFSTTPATPTMTPAWLVNYACSPTMSYWCPWRKTFNA